MAQQSRYNVLLITTDEQRYDALGCNGNPHIRTPHLDTLARQSVNFQRHTTSNPICTPARCSILTGLYSRTHGADTVGKRLPVTQQCLTHLLGEAGYRCGILGKAHFEAELSGYAKQLEPERVYYGFQEHHITEDNQIGEYLRWIRAKHPEHYAAIRQMTVESTRDTPFPTPG